MYSDILQDIAWKLLNKNTRVPPRDWHLLGDLCLQAGAVKLLTSRWMGSSDLETSRRKVGSKGPDSKAARAPSGTFTDTRA